MTRRAHAATDQRTLPDLLERAVEHHKASRFEEAERYYRRALEVAPDDPQTVNLLGTMLATRGCVEDRDESIELLTRAVAHAGPVSRENVGVYSNLGNALRRAERFDEAETVLQQIIAAVPDSFEAWHNLGQLYKRQERFDEATAALRRAIALEPKWPDNHAVLGEVLVKLGRLHAAIASLQRALDLGYAQYDVVSYLGVAFRQLGDLATAERYLRQVVERQPRASGAYTNLGVVLAQQGKFDEARVMHDRAVELDPENITVIANRAYSRLTGGDLPDAWTDWERSMEKGPRGRERTSPARRWRGEDLGGATLMVYREQGVGDEILFASCYEEAIAAAGSTIIETDRRLATLMARSFPAANVRAQTIDRYGQETIDPPDFDWIVPCGSLPAIFRPGVDSFPDRRSYLVADPALVAEWAERLAPHGGPRVGISWRSKLNTAERRLEYTRLAEWGSVFAAPGVSFFNLQYDECERDLADAERRFGVPVHSWPNVDYMNDFESVAALICNLDLVIAPRNAVAMLAGALGVPTVMMGNRWDWSDLGTDAFPWLPTVTLVYRELDHEWDDVLATAAGRVHDLVSTR